MRNNLMLQFRSCQISIRILLIAIRQSVLLICIQVAGSAAKGQSVMLPASTVRPLEIVYFENTGKQTITVTDSRGREYVRSNAPLIKFRTAGAMGRHQIWATGAGGRKDALAAFNLQDTTRVDDGGYYRDMFRLFHHTMCAYAPDGEESVTWNDSSYHYYVYWMLDHCHTAKGMQYFRGRGCEFVDLMARAQRADGMIWSFIHKDENTDYFRTRDKYTGYTKQIGNRVFTRQPTENHPEYNFVNTLYQCWKSTGDDRWMKGHLNAAMRALDYAPNDPARWSKRFGLLKRVYTIDSWDFAVDDEYLPDIGITNSMIIDPVKSKFGVFFGDNTGYIKACLEMEEMCLHAGLKQEGQRFSERARTLQKRLDSLSWNGRFFRHFVDEDPTVKRNLGVDEASQIAQSNAYSLNREIRREQSLAIIETYQELGHALPPGSPGEWYAIYPPFGRGFETHNGKWQYMNGGVAGHAAGELALGALRNGKELYGADVLNRLFELGKKYDNKVYFAYTGALFPPPPPPSYKTIDLSKIANMDHCYQGGEGSFRWMNGGRKGDDLCSIPVGRQVFAGIPFEVLDPQQNQRRSVLAVSRRAGYPVSLDIPVGDTVPAFYLLHTSGKPSSEQLAGVVSLLYEDGSRSTQYMVMGKQLTYWWFSQLKTDYSGIAWYGRNEVSEGVGLSWCAINNPHPSKKIRSIRLQASEDSTIYTVFALTLASRQHEAPVKPVSYGGPDNWAGATATSALLEGLAGVQNDTGSQAYQKVAVSPRWITTKTDSIAVTVRYAASDAYCSYQYIHRRDKKWIGLQLTGNGDAFRVQLPMPPGSGKASGLKINGRQEQPREWKGGDLSYVEIELRGSLRYDIEISYE